MSEPLSGPWLRFAYNGILLYTAVSSGCKMQPEEHPLALVACMVGGITAVFGLLRVIFASGQPEECRKLRDITHGVLELVPLSLTNMDLYMQSTGWSAVTLGHGFFLLPLLCDMRCCLAKNRVDCGISDSLKDLTILGNIVSLGFLAFVERNFLYLRMMLVMAAIRYGVVLVDSIRENAGEDLQVCGTALFLYQLGKAVESVAE
ncbi:uncharacterized protein LOC110177029 [Drosophila serrata]|uniref:uncharacterized protein LOC110177029 n=1 Tax=Drosophila serrata TaxID=7274 RepID=UPI000A1D2D40|nr:uncharacterized protein LOC110177029 [Drosophila serrata]KAH8385365.1 hypothetical protein KR200_005048 [Drosophila serrata]